jgi:predicted metal-binding membrane protein
MAARADDTSLLRSIARRPRLLVVLCVAAVSLPIAGALPETDATTTPWELLAWMCSGDGMLARSAGTPAILSMWLAMTFGMMLPSALPMVSTYADIGEAARAKAIRVVPAAVLVLGYLTVWMGFSVAAAFVQGAVARSLVGQSTATLASAGIFLVAGIYQFSSLKHACLTKCRQPLPFFMERWSDRPLAVYAMGLEQGISCFGCCWALMLLMFVAGTMNIAWMAGLAVVMLLEKTLADPRPLSFGLGAGLIAAGLAALVIG